MDLIFVCHNPVLYPSTFNNTKHTQNRYSWRVHSRNTLAVCYCFQNL